MNKYYIERFYKTPVSLSTAKKIQEAEELPYWNFNFPDDKVTVYVRDELRKIDGNMHHFGLTVIAEVCTDTLEEANNLSQTYSEALMNMLVLTSLAKCSAPRVVSTITFADKGGDKFENTILILNATDANIRMIPIKKEKFETIFKACINLAKSERAMRAMSWFRKGMNERNTIDKFISFWVGLEVLKGVLSEAQEEKAQSFVNRMRGKICSIICKRRLPNTNKDEWKAIRQVFAEKLGRDDFNKIKIIPT